LEYVTRKNLLKNASNHINIALNKEIGAAGSNDGVIIFCCHCAWGGTLFQYV